MNELVRAGVIARVELGHEPEFALGPIQVRPSRREVVGAGTHEILEPRVMQVLVALVRARGEILSRDDLIESCWDGVVVGEDAIQRCVGRLRKLAEASGNTFVIETISRVGYRLKVAKTDAVSQVPSTDAPEAQPLSALVAAVVPPPWPTTAEPRRPVGWKWKAVVSAVGVLVLLTAGLALWRFWPSKPPPKPAAPIEASVAVLPFVNMSGDPKQEYFSDGFSEELINDLTNVPHLNVASRTSSFAFKGRNENIGTIARALGVHAIVEGSVRESGNRVRIAAQLIDASNGYHLWSADYSRNLSDILSLQDELARAIATALTHRLVPAPSAPRPKIDPAVYRLYLEGVHQFNDVPEPQGWRRAVAIFKQVTERAPDFADGFASLSRAAVTLAFNFDAWPASDFALASAAAQHALSLDPHNVLARSVRGYVALGAWDWRAAASNVRILRNQNPNSVNSGKGLWNFYARLGFPDEALAQWRHSYKPDEYRSALVTLWALDWAGRFQEEIDMGLAQLVHNPRDTNRMDYLCSAYSAAGQIAQARAVEERIRSLQTDFESRSFLRDCELYIDVATGNRAGALKLLHIGESEHPDKQASGPGFSGVSAASFGATYVLLGDFDKATGWFERAYERREPYFFPNFRLRGLGYEKAIEKYRRTTGYKALAARPLFREWQAEHDRIAAALAAHRDPLK